MDHEELNAALPDVSDLEGVAKLLKHMRGRAVPHHLTTGSSPPEAGGPAVNPSSNASADDLLVRVRGSSEELRRLIPEWKRHEIARLAMEELRRLERDTRRIQRFHSGLEEHGGREKSPGRDRALKRLQRRLERERRRGRRACQRLAELERYVRLTYEVHVLAGAVAKLLLASVADRYASQAVVRTTALDIARRLRHEANASGLEWYRVADVATLLERRVETVRDWCRDKRLAARKTDDEEWRVHYEEIIRYLNHGLRPEETPYRYQGR